MDHKTLVFQILRTQIITNMPCKGWSRAQSWGIPMNKSASWPRRLKSYPARTQKGRSGQLGRWIPSLCLSPHKGPLLFTKPPVGIFSLISCQISDPVLVLPQKGPGPLQHSALSSLNCSQWFQWHFHFQRLRHGLEGPPGSRQRTVPAVRLPAPRASRKAHKGASCNIHTPSEHIPCVPVGFGWGHSWPRTRRQTLEQTFSKIQPLWAGHCGNWVEDLP